METTRPPGFPGNPPARMPRAPTPARSPPPRPLRCGEITFRPTHDVGPHKQCISGLNHAAYGLPVNASRPGSPQAHASLGSGWRPTLAGWDWIPTGFRTRFQRSHHGILSPLTGLSRHTRCCTNRDWPARCQPTGSSPADAIRHGSAEGGHPIEDFTAEDDLTPLPSWAPGAKALSVCDTRARAPSGTRRRVSYPVSDSMSCRRRARGPVPCAVRALRSARTDGLGDRSLFSRSRPPPPARSSLRLIAEIGTDMTRWPSRPGGASDLVDRTNCRFDKVDRLFN